MVDDKVIEKIKFHYLQENGGLVMQWLGESSIQFPQKFLNPYFTEILPSIADFKSFTIDFMEFDYMNSGTVQPILFFIKGLNTLNIPIFIYYSKDKKWQVLSFQVLKTVAHILKNITIEAK